MDLEGFTHNNTIVKGNRDVDDMFLCTKSTDKCMVVAEKHIKMLRVPCFIRKVFSKVNESRECDVIQI